MKRLTLVGIWAVAIFSLSRLFHAQREWAELGSVGFGLETALWALLFAASLFILSLRMYAIERRRGNVTRPVGMFERILEQRGTHGVD